MVIVTLVHTPLLIKDFPVVPRTNTRDPWFWEISKLDKNKPPYLPSKEEDRV
jgi:hypothetical protein